MSEGALEDVEDHYGRKGGCSVDLVPELDIGEKGEKDDEGAADKVKKHDEYFEDASFAIGL